MPSSIRIVMAQMPSDIFRFTWNDEEDIRNDQTRYLIDTNTLIIRARLVG